MARLLGRGLQEEGHQVDLCASADSAAQQALDISYDVILLDWMRPDQDGVTLLRGWRKKGLRASIAALRLRSPYRKAMGTPVLTTRRPLSPSPAGLWAPSGARRALRLRLLADFFNAQLG